MRKILAMLSCMLIIFMVTSVCLAQPKEAEQAMQTVQPAKDADQSLTVAKMAEQIKDLEGKEFCVEATIIGACKSGCKMWIADGEYKEGDLFTLVRAKDDAFKFDTNKQGTRVRLTGYVMAKFKDYCGDAAEAGKPEPEAGKQAGSCKAPVKVETATKGDLQEMTFFATKVDYLGES